MGLRQQIITKIDRLFARMDRSRAFGWWAGGALMAASLFPKFIHDLAADSSVYVYLAARLLHGEHYCADFLEYNTPFAIGAFAPAIWLGSFAGFNAGLSAKLFIFGLTLAGILLVHRIIRPMREWQNTTRYNALIIALFYALNLRVDFYGNEITTRTSLFLCLALPYLFLLQRRLAQMPSSLRQDIASGVLAGLCVWLKPHYALLPLIGEIYLAYRHRSLQSLLRRANWLAAGVVVLGYGVIIPRFFPGYYQCLPEMLTYYETARTPLDNIPVLLAYMVPVLLWGWAIRPLRIPMQLFWLLLAALFCILNAEILLSWDQRALLCAAINLGFIYSLLVLLRHTDEAKMRLGRVRNAAAIIGAILLCATSLNLTKAIGMFLPHETFREKTVRDQVDYITRYAPDAPVFSFSDSAEHFAPAMLKVGARTYPPVHAMRESLALWGRGGAAAYDARILRFFRNTPPALVFVSRINGPTPDACLPVPFEMMHARNREFAALWDKNYHKIGAIRHPREAYWLEAEPLSPPDQVWLDVYGRNPQP